MLQFSKILCVAIYGTKMQLYDIEIQFQQAKTVPQLTALLEQLLQNLGFDTYSFTYYTYHLNSTHKLKYHFASKNYLAWHEHYINEGYEDIDTTLHFSHRQTLPVFWDLETQLQQAKTKRERQMRLDSIEFGVECGLLVPIHGPQEDFAILLVAQRQGQTCLREWRGLQYDLFVIAYLYYQHLQKHLLNVSQDNLYQLTERELQCLTLIAQQMPPHEIANRLEITERTVNFHIQKINKKFGVKNKHQAVTKAKEKNIIVV